MSYDYEADRLEAKATTEQKANKIYAWMLEYLAEYVDENTEDPDQFEVLYEMVWKKFQNKK